MYMVGMRSAPALLVSVFLTTLHGGCGVWGGACSESAKKAGRCVTCPPECQDPFLTLWPARMTPSRYSATAFSLSTPGGRPCVNNSQSLAGMESGRAMQPGSGLGAMSASIAACLSSGMGRGLDFKSQPSTVLGLTMSCAASSARLVLVLLSHSFSLLRNMAVLFCTIW